MKPKKRDSDHTLSRRQWLSSVTALAATAIGPVRPVRAQAGPTRPFRIDTHHHHSQGGPWVPGRSIEAMDRSGIVAAILSRPGIAVSEGEKARKLARDANEFGAQIVRDHPSRFGLFATLPLFDVDGSLREIAYGFDVLKADGTCFSTSYGNKWIGDPTFAPIFDELNRRRAVVFVHPTPPGFYTDDLMLENGAIRGQSGVQPAAMEMMFDSARAIVSLILNGTLYRCPDIRFIFGHGGGTLPYLHERLNHLIGEDLPAGGEWTTGDGRYRSKYVPNGFVNEMKKVYFDVVRVANAANFALLRQLMPPDRLLLGTDYPIVATSETVGHLPNLGLDGNALRGLERENALRLFPRFRG
jgi:6-methylsalicylate decarboxylase